MPTREASLTQSAIAVDDSAAVVAATPALTRVELLKAAKRPMTPIRHAFVQKVRGSESRAAALAQLVAGKQTQALDAFLLLLALQPILIGDPLPGAVWARLLSPAEPQRRVPASGVSRIWNYLETHQLVTRGTRIGRLADVTPLHESANGQPYTRPGRDGATTGKGYFWLPNEYWTDGWHETLSLPGKAMLLVWLSATSEPSKTDFNMSFAQAKPWYGISERSAERGIRELKSLNLITETIVKVTDVRSPVGWTYRHNRSLIGPFGTGTRRDTHRQMVANSRRASRAASGSDVTPVVSDALESSAFDGRLRTILASDDSSTSTNPDGSWTEQGVQQGLELTAQEIRPHANLQPSKAV